MRSRPTSAAQLDGLHSVSHGHVPGQLLGVIMIHKWLLSHVFLICLVFFSVFLLLLGSSLDGRPFNNLGAAVNLVPKS